jgi:arginine decarboxylase
VIPTRLFFTKGVGKHKEKLQSFEFALRDAGIQFCNLVNVSSICPPGAKIIPREKGVKMLKPGEITFLVLARNATNEPNRLIGTSIGCALPSDPTEYGYLSEHHSFGETAEKAGDYSEDLAASMLASTLGIEFDADKAYDDRKAEFKISGKIVKTTNCTQTAEGDKNGLWTTVIAAAVFVPEDDYLSYEEDSKNGKVEGHQLQLTKAQTTAVQPVEHHDKAAAHIAHK